MRVRRAVLYVPGHERKKIEKATTLDVDCVCLDLEDGVPESEKGEARVQVVESLRILSFSGAERIVRINQIGSGFESDDLDAVLPVQPDAILIPKVDHCDQVHWVSSKISDFEEDTNLERGYIPLLILIESPIGIINLDQLAKCDERLEAIAIGAEDLATSIGATRTEAGWEVFYARSKIIMYTAAHGLQAIDMIYGDINNIVGLQEDCLHSMRMGFSGKQVIHPVQINTVQDAFTPNEQEINRALRILDEYRRQLSMGHSIFTMEGKMIEPPNILKAENIIERAKAAGKLE